MCFKVQSSFYKFIILYNVFDSILLGLLHIILHRPKSLWEKSILSFLLTSSPFVQFLPWRIKRLYAKYFHELFIRYFTKESTQTSNPFVIFNLFEISGNNTIVTDSVRTRFLDIQYFYVVYILLVNDWSDVSDHFRLSLIIVFIVYLYIYPHKRSAGPGSKLHCSLVRYCEKKVGSLFLINIYHRLLLRVNYKCFRVSYRGQYEKTDRRKKCKVFFVKQGKMVLELFYLYDDVGAPMYNAIITQQK